MAMFGGGPTGLGMFGNQIVPGDQQGGGFMQNFDQRMNNPLVAAALGAGGAMMGSQGDFGEALRGGIFGGAGSAYGALRMNQQRQKDKEREDMMKQLLERYSRVADQAPFTPQMGGQMFGGGQMAQGGLF